MILYPTLRLPVPLMTRTTSDTHLSVTGHAPPAIPGDTADPRIPTQERGTRRVEAILDAAAELVAEVGVEGVTVQALAHRATTSKGSLYHFFPDVPSVLRALADRHFGEIDAIVANVKTDRTLDWQRMAAEDVVAALLSPLDYLEQHCDLLALVRAPGLLTRSARSMKPMLELVEYVLGARFPRMKAARRNARAATLVAVIDGVVGTASRGCSHGADSMRRELEELLVLYLVGLHPGVTTLPS